MTDVLQEVTGPEITRAHIERRIGDWSRRVDDLYALVQQWLPPNWTVERRRTVRMHEEMMREFGVPPREMPILDLLHNGVRAASLEPRALWVIGANGRLDFVCGNKHYIVVDAAENFTPPKWRIASLTDRRRLEVFDAAKVQTILS